MLRTVRIFVCVFALNCLALLGASPASRRGADVHLTFSGLICHIFDAGHEPRSVTMRGTEAMPHRATLYLQEGEVESSEVLLTCDGTECTLDLANTGLRFASAGSPSFSRGGSFDNDLSAPSVSHEWRDGCTEGNVFDDVPSRSSPISASFLLPSGDLSAVAYDQMARYDPDFEGRGIRPFAHDVILDGHVPIGQLLVRRAGDAAWRRITFTDDIDLRIVNKPTLGTDARTRQSLS